MDTHSALVDWSEILLPPLGIALTVMLSALVGRTIAPSWFRKMRWRLVALTAMAQLLVYMAAFVVSFGLGDAGTHVPWPISAVAAVLGFPLMYVLDRLPGLGFGRSVLGDGLVLLSVLASINAMIWGFAVAYLIKRRQPANSP